MRILSNLCWEFLVLCSLGFQVQAGVFVQQSAHIWVYRGYNEACSEGIDKIRTDFKDKPLAWDDTIAKSAEDWALTQAINAPRDNMKHSGVRMGENLFMSTFVTRDQFNEAVMCATPMWSWYVDRDVSYVALLIQMVHEDVTKFGIGMAVNTNTKSVHFVGQFNPNVHKSPDVWNRLKAKEQYRLTKNDLKSNKGQLVPTCYDDKRNVVPCVSFNRRNYHNEEEELQRKIEVIEPGKSPIVL